MLSCETFAKAAVEANAGKREVSFLSVTGTVDPVLMWFFLTVENYGKIVTLLLIDCEMNDRQLIERMQQGDMIAFGELYKRHIDSCRRFASLSVGSSAAEDVVHDVFCRLWEKRLSVLSVESLRPFLLRAIYNASLNVIRKDTYSKKFKNEYSRKLELASTVLYDPDNNEIIRKLFSQDASVTIEDAISLLPDKCQKVFRLSYLEGKTHKEIADLFGLSVSTVDNHIFKALKFLRGHLSKEMFSLVVSVCMLKFFS